MLRFDIINIGRIVPRNSGLFFGRASNTFLRLGSLAAKLIFTLYMGRYLGLADMGTYGLITAYVAVLVALLGLRFDYASSRDIVDAPPVEVAHRIRDQIIFYALNYLVLIFITLLALPVLLRNANTEIIFMAILLSILESLAAVTSGNFVSLKRPILANGLFFIRAALWTLPVMLLGIFFPAFRTAEVILFWWILGVLASLGATFYAWRYLPWAQTLKKPVDWHWINRGVKKCFFIWIGVIGMTAATYVDRFVVEHYLGLDYVGIASFYGSFVIAIQSLLLSGVFAFSYPQLISHHRRSDTVLFRHEVRRMTIHASLFAGLMVLGVGAAVPILGHLFHRPEFSDYAFTLWLMLFGIWLRSATESLYYVLYARHQDNLVWIGNLLMLIPAFSGNMLFVPLMGFQGIGYSAVATAVFVCIWRLFCVIWFQPEGVRTAALAQSTNPAE